MFGAAFPFIPALGAPLVSTGLWPNGYRYRLRRVITAVVHRQPTGAAAWVKYRMTSTAALRSVANGGHVENDAAWPDIRFETGNGAVIRYELESWSSTTGALVAWLLLTGFVAGANYTVLLYYGKAGILANEFAAAACWAGFGQSVNMATGLDRSGNERNFTLTGVAASTLFGGAAGDFG